MARTQTRSLALAELSGFSEADMPMVVLQNVMDRMVSLMEGATASRAMPTRRFQHVPTDMALEVQMAARRPFPFRMDLLTTFQPESVPGTMVADYTYLGATIAVMIAYTMRGNQEFALQKEQVADVDQIRRVIGYSPNYSSVSGFSRSLVGDVSFSADELGSIIVAAIPVHVTYREDFS